MQLARLGVVLLLAIALSAATLPLKEVRDWNDRPLLTGTAVVLKPGGEVVAITYITEGKVEGELPWEPGYILKIAWGHLTIDDIKRGLATWIYDSSNLWDVAGLGNPVFPKILTYVYPLTVTVQDRDHRPLPGCRIRLVDAVTGGRLYSGEGETGSDGSAIIVPRLGAISQIPPGQFSVEVYCGDILAAKGSITIDRGVAVPAFGLHVSMVIDFVRSLPIVGGIYGEGYLILRGVKFVNGSIGDVTVPFRAGDRVLVLEREVPLLNQSAVLHLTRLSVGGFHQPGRQLSGTLAELLALLSSSEQVSVTVVDRGGAVRKEWHVEVLLGNNAVAYGQGRVEVMLPPSALVGEYKARVISPSGLMKEIPLSTSDGRAEAVVTAVVVTVQAVDGFGEVRRDWEVEIVGVAKGAGEISAELVEGDVYEAKARALGFVNSTKFNASDAVIRIKIPTSRLAARVVDGFGVVRSDWNVEIRGVARGNGEVGPVEVLAGRYVVATSVFGREFSQTVDVPVGKVVNVTLDVPTARLNVSVVDENKKPIANVTSVEISGPVNLLLNAPGDVELLAGVYTVRVTALGKSASAEVSLEPGKVANLVIVTPGTAAQSKVDLLLVVAVAAVGVAVAIYVVATRKR